jgi:hypothetical protein
VCKKKAHEKRLGGASLSSHPLSQTCRNDSNSNSRGGKKRPPRLSRWKRIRTRALFLFCCVVLLVFYVYDFSSSHQISKFLSAVTTTVFFLSIHFFSLTRDSFFFFFFFRVLDVPFALVLKKQGREKDSGVLYASSSFRERRFCWRRR